MSGSESEASRRPSFEPLLAEAKAALEANDHQRAEAIYRQLADEAVADPTPYCNLAALALMDQRNEEALCWLDSALEHDPSHARSHLNRGMALHQLGRHEEAAEALRRALDLDSSLVEGWNNLGVALAALDRPEPAMEAYQRALALRSDHSRAAVNLSVLLANHRQAARGEAVLRQLPSQAVDASVLFHLGEMLRLQGRSAESLRAYNDCLERDPADWELRFAVGQALIGCGQSDEAVAVLLPLLAMRPNDAMPLAAVGWALHKLGELEQAIHLLRRALELDPSLVGVHNLLGLCYALGGDQSAAIREFRLGLEQAPTDVEMRCNLAGALRSQGDLEASMAELEAVLAESPDCQAALIIQMFSCSIGSEQLAPLNLELARRYWALIRRQPPELALGAVGSAAAATPTGAAMGVKLAAAPAGMPSLASGARAGVVLTAPDPSSAPLATAQLADAPPADGRLRVGFLSAEIGDHVVGSFLAPFLRFHNRERIAVELFSASRRFDATAQRLAEQAERHWLLCGMEMGPARELIRRRRLDVLVETSGFTSDSALDLLAERCAPIQCHYIGYHASTGLDTLDWFIGDEETVPAAFASQYVEGLWRLPRPWLAREADIYLPPLGVRDPKDGPVLGSFNQMAKVRRETLRFWGAALRAVPAAGLLLKDRSSSDAVVQQRILATLEEEGIERRRVRFLPHQGNWAEHMGLYARMDVALDTTPWSSATTAFDALSMGVPLVAIRGRCTSARMSSSLLRGLGHPDWVAETPEAYGAIVAALCSDLTTLRQNREGLRHALLASPLMDGRHLARSLEEAFAAMHARHAGKNPAPAL